MKNEKFIYFLISVFLLLTFFKSSVFAQSDYVLPYPSGMPGSLLYKIRLIYENVSKYWYFGDFGQFDYSLKMADKYLVEAKTLFEYKQYLLGYKALKKSDRYFPNSLASLVKAEKNNKNISQKTIMLRQAALKHIEILEKMRINSPNVFNWQPEKTPSTILNIDGEIKSAINIRKNAL